ncbi:hypothetical protein [Puia dinghuensis]|uniref:Uncharacterized protein n=1 Tax=Puia dinghuensis TaxID=1792502 RepID=A0A8J2UAB8_9BACT|nr:hypothetical protein [Puia dinghuensis]GGA90012.1 hypothetical protein GCM10011511_11570 [Puia dinghuensis]
MSDWKKIALAAAGCGVLVYYGRRLARMKANLIITPQVSVQSIGLTGVVLRTDVQIKNPSDSGFSIKFPFVTLLYKDSLLGSSKVVNQNITINAYSEVNIQKILIEIPLSGVLSVASGLLSFLQNKQPVKIIVKTATVVDLGWKRLDYTDTQEIDLKN